MSLLFDSREAGDYMPYHYDRHCVVYTGTHDNQTLKAWFYELSEEDRREACEYLDLDPDHPGAYWWKFIRLALGSVADTAVVAMQDYLGLGAEARMNQPSTLGGNWSWRLVPGQLSDELLDQIARMTKLYGRNEE